MNHVAICFFILTSILTNPLTAQNPELDSLWGVWNDSNQGDSVRLKALDKVIWKGLLFTKPDSAAKLAQTQFAFAEEKGIQRFQSRSVGTQGVANSIMGNFEQAEVFYLEAFRMDSAWGDSSAMAADLMRLGIVNSQKGNLEGAIGFYERSIEQHLKNGDTAKIAAPTSNMAIAFRLQGNYPGAIDALEKALRLLNPEKEGEHVANIYNEFGSIYTDQEEHALALKNYQASADIYRREGMTWRYGTALSNVGIALKQLEQFGAALDSSIRAYHLQDSLGDRTGLLVTLSNLLDLEMSREDYDLGEAYGKEAVQLTNELGAYDTKSFLLSRLGSLKLNTGQPRAALRLGLEAMELAEQVDQVKHINGAAELLYHVYRALGNDRKSLEMYELHIQSRDSMDNLRNISKALSAQFRYEYEKKEAAQLARYEAEQAAKNEIIKAKDEAIQVGKRIRIALIGILVLFVLLLYGVWDRFRITRKKNTIIQQEKERSDELLLNILPFETAQELKEKGKADAKLFDLVTVLFTDFKGFTRLSEGLPPGEIVAGLDRCFSAFDEIVERHKIEKIKTIGDAYMAAGGLPTPTETHAKQVALVALEIQEYMDAYIERQKAIPDDFFEIRIGLHTGPVVAGIVGLKKFQYDIWGDTVNTASRMESNSEIGKINVSKVTYEMLKDDPDFAFSYRGSIEVKGKGQMEMYFLSRATPS